MIDSTLSGGERLAAAIRTPKRAGAISLMPYVTAGFPRRAGFGESLRALAEISDAIEVGLPFSDPVADGPVIAKAGREALERGVCLPWLLDEVAAAGELAAPLVLMTYLNPLLARGLEATLRAVAAAGFAGLIVPDLPLEEATEARETCDDAGLALVQLVTPLTAPERARELCRASRGFVYAVTRAGITGASTRTELLDDYLARLRAASSLPVAAGFGIRDRTQVERIAPHADGVIVGTALVEVLARGEDPLAFLESLRPPTSPSPTLPEASR